MLQHIYQLACLWKAIHHTAEPACWLQPDLIEDLKELIQIMDHPQIELIPYHWKRIAIGLAGLGIQSTQLSLFHMGMEKPNWLMKMFTQAGFSF